LQQKESGILIPLGLFTKASGKAATDTDLESSSGKMAPGTSDNGVKIKLVGSASSFILMATSTKDSGTGIKPTALVFMSILMELSTQDSGKMTYNMAWVLKLGAMTLVMRACIIWGSSMDLDSTSGMMDLLLRESGKITRYVALVSIHGSMVGAMKANGLKITCKALANIIGAMDALT
jgi:hypothetical protein